MSLNDENCTFTANGPTGYAVDPIQVVGKIESCWALFNVLRGTNYTKCKVFSHVLNKHIDISKGPEHKEENKIKAHDSLYITIPHEPLD